MNGTTARDYGYQPKPKHQEINCVDYMKFEIDRSTARTPNGKLLGIILASMVDPQRHTGLICPSDDRLMAFTGWSAVELEQAIQDLVTTGQWEVDTDAQGLVHSYRPTYRNQLPSVRDEVADAVRGSKDVFLWIARYSRLPTVLRLAFVHAVATQKARWNFLGSKGNQWTYGINGTKLFYASLFDHPVIRDNSAANHAYLADLKIVPYDIQPITYELRLHELSQRTGLDPHALGYALMEPQTLMHVTPLGGDRIQFTATMELHQHLWDFFRIPGGADRNAFELAQGYMTFDQDVPTAINGAEALVARPPAAFHWIYELALDGAVLQVGQSTGALRSRLEGHLLSPTNPYAQGRTERLLAAGTLPTIRLIDLVHHYEVNEAEVYWIQRRKAEGHHLGNWIVDQRSNASTIASDSRLAAWPGSRVSAFLDATWRHWKATGAVLTPQDVALAL